MIQNLEKIEDIVWSSESSSDHVHFVSKSVPEACLFHVKRCATQHVPNSFQNYSEEIKKQLQRMCIVGWIYIFILDYVVYLQIVRL